MSCCRWYYVWLSKFSWFHNSKFCFLWMIKLQIVFRRHFQGGVDLHLHTFVLWASDWRRIEQTLHSRRSPPETEVFLLLEDIFSLNLFLWKAYWNLFIFLHNKFLKSQNSCGRRWYFVWFCKKKLVENKFKKHVVICTINLQKSIHNTSSPETSFATMCSYPLHIILN